MRRRYYIAGGAVLVTVLALFAVISMVAGPAHMNEQEMADMVATMFTQMQSDGINPDQNLLWGYYFTDPNRAKLATAASDLQKQGYKVVELRQASWFPQTFQLHIERIEKHTVSSLNRRNRELNSYAERNKIDCYDGMDVGPPDGKSSFEDWKKEGDDRR